MALYGGIYIPCLFGLLPDKSGETYDRFFGMVWQYNDANNLHNTFMDQFFMCDFEVARRSSVILYWPTASILGCFFHFSQVILSFSIPIEVYILEHIHVYLWMLHKLLFFKKLWITLHAHNFTYTFSVYLDCLEEN